MQFVDVVVAAGWAGAGAGQTPTGTEASSALLAIAITAGVLLLGRRVDRQQAEKILPFRRIVLPCITVLMMLQAVTAVRAPGPAGPQLAARRATSFFGAIAR